MSLCSPGFSPRSLHNALWTLLFHTTNQKSLPVSKDRLQHSTGIDNLGTEKMPQVRPQINLTQYSGSHSNRVDTPGEDYF